MKQISFAQIQIEKKCKKKNSAPFGTLFSFWLLGTKLMDWLLQ